MNPTANPPNTETEGPRPSNAPSTSGARQPDNPGDQLGEQDIASATDWKRLIASQKRELAAVSYKLADAEEKLDSLRYKLGTLVVEAFLHPGLKTLALPVDLIKLWRNKPASGIADTRNSPHPALVRREPHIPSEQENDLAMVGDAPRNTILFVPINGTGLGHLTRCMAIANEVLARAPEKQIIFLTTSIALPILFEQDFFAYHVPPRSPFEYLLSEKQWNELFENTLNNILRIHKPGTIVFDGTYPYDGLLRSLQAHAWIKSIWVKRGLYRADTFSETVKRLVNHFDHIIVPGELDGTAVDASRGKTTEVAPIIYRPSNGQMSKEDARRTLRLDENQPVAYVQLGAGNINDIQDLAQRVVDALNARFPQLQIVIGESPITRSRFKHEGRYLLLKDFPNSNYFKAFDIAILAAGYNSVYETVFFHLPTIFLPRMVGTDNQLARARLAEKFGTARVIEEFDSELLCMLVSEMLERSCADSHPKPSFSNGAERAAASIVAMANAVTADA